MTVKNCVSLLPFESVARVECGLCNYHFLLCARNEVSLQAKFVNTFQVEEWAMISFLCYGCITNLGMSYIKSL